MPLVWAHAEYVKLLRSVTDGKVFDCISAVEQRYKGGKRPPPVEVFRLNRQLQSIIAGRKLRVLADDHFMSCGRWMTGTPCARKRAHRGVRGPFCRSRN